MIGKVSSSMMGKFGAVLEIILILYPLQRCTVLAMYCNNRIGNFPTDLQIVCVTPVSNNELQFDVSPSDRGVGMN